MTLEEMKQMDPASVDRNTLVDITETCLFLYLRQSNKIPASVCFAAGIQ